ncbi:MAG: hypothetical protein R2838_19910 [Caldilineaceae bacterium]
MNSAMVHHSLSPYAQAVDLWQGCVFRSCGAGHGHFHAAVTHRLVQFI